MVITHFLLRSATFPEYVSAKSHIQPLTHLVGRKYPAVGRHERGVRSKVHLRESRVHSATVAIVMRVNLHVVAMAALTQGCECASGILSAAILQKSSRSVHEGDLFCSRTDSSLISPSFQSIYKRSPKLEQGTAFSLLCLCMQLNLQQLAPSHVKRGRIAGHASPRWIERTFLLRM